MNPTLRTTVPPVRPVRLVLFCLLAGRAGVLTAQANHLEPRDVFNLEYAADPQISPDGQWVVYVRQYSDIMTDKRYSNLWLVRADGSDHRPVTTGQFTETTPRWSPDGKRLAFISNRGGGSPQIYVRWMDTGQLAPVTSVTEPPAGGGLGPYRNPSALTQLVPGETPAHRA